MKFLFLLTFVIGSLSFTGCDDSTTGSEESVTMEDVLEEGWDYYSANNYLEALNSFNSAIEMEPTSDDAWNGAGWSAGQLIGRQNDAEEYFLEALNLNSLKYDAAGGLIFVLYQKSELNQNLITDVLNRSLTLLNDKPLWRFVHNTSINYNDVRLIIASSYYKQGNFEESFNTIKDYLNLEFEADWNTAQGQRKILQELERLRQIYG